MDTEKTDKTLTDKQKKVISISVFAAFLLFCAAVTYGIGKPMISLVSDPENFRKWVESLGVGSRFVFVGMMIFQVVIALVPGEPLEIGAGYVFGAVEGTLLCLVGTAIGSIIVFLLVRKFGVRLVEVFFSHDKIKSLKFLQNEKRLDFITFIIFFLPGTPKDLITYFAGLTDIKISTFLIITSVARIPSVITSTMGGSALGVENYKTAIIVFIITLVISVTGLIIYNRICSKKSKKAE